MALSNEEALQVGNFNPSIVDDIKALACVGVDAANSASVASGIQACTVKQMAFLLPDAATATYLYTVPEKMEIVDVTCIKSAAGAANTVQLKNGSGTAISNAIATDTNLTVTRAGTLDPATRTLAAGAQLQITATRAAGSMLCTVIVHYIPRA